MDPDLPSVESQGSYLDLWILFLAQGQVGMGSNGSILLQALGVLVPGRRVAPQPRPRPALPCTLPAACTLCGRSSPHGGAMPVLQF